jgi:hemerythrin-like domain-containing protein
MKDETKPIKRSEQLSPLSREHHDGLLFIWKIRQGVRYGIDVDRIAPFVKWFWQSHLQSHFKKEEDLLPAVLPATTPLMQQMFAEHASIKNYIDKTDENVDYGFLENLANLVNDHIRFEERQLFNEIEKAATADQLQHLATQLQDEENGADWKDEFWVRKK